jgi:predicted nucleotidyltransferase
MKGLDKTSLTDAERRAVKAAAEELRMKFSVDKVILFGSMARGDRDEHSDIDLLILTSRPLHWREEKGVVEILFDIGMEHDVIFSPLFASTDEWDGGLFTNFPVFHEIGREGALV